MKNKLSFIIFLLFPLFHLNSQISFNYQNQQLSQLEFKEHLIDADFRGVSSVYSADIDGDGDVDVLGSAERASEIAWWENLDVGSGSFYKHTIDDDFSWAAKVYAADIDGDGDIDVLGGAGKIVWWENTEADTFTKHLPARQAAPVIEHG